MTGVAGLHLRVLPCRVVLASLSKDILKENTYPLLKLILFEEQKFFSFTETSEEISLVLEEHALSYFPDQALRFTNQIWKIIQVDEGPLGFESVGIVNSISAPLAENHISIYHLSTYLTDHTLVEEENLEKAVATLQAAGFIFTNAEHSPPSSPPPTKQTLKTPSLGDMKGGKQAQMVITRLPYELYLAKLPENWSETLAKPLLKLLFEHTQEDKDRLLSLTLTPSEASLILDSLSLSLFPPNSLDRCTEVWRALQICEGAYGFNEYGIVSKFAGPLAEAKISIFNLSTYITDYALVAENTIEEAMIKLKERFEIITDEEEQ